MSSLPRVIELSVILRTHMNKAIYMCAAVSMHVCTRTCARAQTQTHTQLQCTYIHLKKRKSNDPSTWKAETAEFLSSRHQNHTMGGWVDGWGSVEIIRRYFVSFCEIAFSQ